MEVQVGKKAWHSKCKTNNSLKGLWRNLSFAFFGLCSVQEDMALAAGIPNFLQKSIILQTFGKRGHHVCQTENSIQIPPFVPASAIDSEWHPEKKHRDIWAYFRGKIELHPKNVSGRVYSRFVQLVKPICFRFSQCTLDFHLLLMDLH
jgi:hypothetical protein